MQYPVPPPDDPDHYKLKSFYHRQYLDTRKAARDALIAAKISSMRDFKNKRDSWVVQKRVVSNEAVKRNIPWLTRERFPNLWPLDEVAITYLTEGNKYARQIQNANTEVQDMPRVGSNEERVEDDEPSSEKEVQEQGNVCRNPGSTSSDTHCQAEGDNESELFGSLTAVNRVDEENRHGEEEYNEEEEDRRDDEWETAVVSPKGKGKRRVYPFLSLPVTGKRAREHEQVKECPTKAANPKHRKVPRRPSFLIDSAIEEEDRLLMRPLPRHITVPSASTSSSRPHTSSAQSARRQAESEDLRAVRAILEDSGSDFGHNSREGTSQGAAGRTSDQGGTQATRSTTPATRGTAPSTRTAARVTRGTAPATRTAAQVTRGTAPATRSTTQVTRSSALMTIATSTSAIATAPPQIGPLAEQHT